MRLSEAYYSVEIRIITPAWEHCEEKTIRATVGPLGLEVANIITIFISVLCINKK